MGNNVPLFLVCQDSDLAPTSEDLMRANIPIIQQQQRQENIDSPM